MYEGKNVCKEEREGDFWRRRKSWRRYVRICGFILGMRIDSVHRAFPRAR